jgi:hypothetical protein
MMNGILPFFAMLNTSLYDHFLTGCIYFYDAVMAALLSQSAALGFSTYNFISLPHKKLKLALYHKFVSISRL